MLRKTPVFDFLLCNAVTLKLGSTIGVFIVFTNTIPILIHSLHSFFLGLNELAAFAGLQNKPITVQSQKQELCNVQVGALCNNC